VALKPIEAEELVSGAYFHRVDVSNSALPKGQLTGLKLESSHMYDVWLRWVTLRGCEIKYSLLERVNLRNADLQSVDFTGTTFVECDLSQAKIECCRLWYVRFERCRLNYESVLGNLPEEDNLQTQVLRALRVNAANEGDTKTANNLLLRELDSERRNLYHCFSHTSKYYENRYKGKKRVWAFVLWLGHWFQRLGWGYGLRLLNLSVSVASLVLVMSLFVYWSQTPYNIGGNNVPRALNFGEALYITIITFCTVGFGDLTPAASVGRFMAGLTAVCGVVAWGFFVAAIYRRLAK